MLNRRHFLIHSLRTAFYAALIAGPVGQALAAGAKVAPTRNNKPRIVMIDPGHGGRDPGAIGLAGTYEKEVTLDIAEQMRDILDGIKGIKPQLTRRKDEFLPLAERVQRGQEAGADLFISIHADSAPTQSARGVSAYTLAKAPTDEFTKLLAVQENKADQIGGLGLPTDDEHVAEILFDLATRHTRNASLRAKAAIIKGAGRELPLLDNPMRAANFAVLRAPDVPSLLVETGFLSNPEDENLLRTAKHRGKVARILARELATVLQSDIFAV